MTNLKTVNTHLEKTLKKVNEKIKKLNEDLTTNNVTEQALENMYKNERLIKEKINQLYEVKNNLENSIKIMNTEIK